MQEVCLLKNINHPNIVRYVHSMIENRILYLILEYCEEGDLGQHINFCIEKRERFPEELIAYWSLQILTALEFLHDNKIMHRDIKAKNVFLTSKCVIKLGDFGVSRVMKPQEEIAQTYAGTYTNISPEILLNKKHNFKTDIWSLGILEFFVNL
jgi:NIMA (never in mitosis gene a)-related kinase